MDHPLLIARWYPLALILREVLGTLFGLKQLRILLICHRGCLPLHVPPVCGLARVFHHCETRSLVADDNFVNQGFQ